MKRYRYILAKCEPSEPICNYRLVSSAYIASVAREPGRVYVRVWIPDDMKLVKHSSDIYSTTDDTRTIEELGYDLIMTQWTNRRKVVCYAWGLPLMDIEKASQEELRKYINSRFADRSAVLKEVK